MTSWMCSAIDVNAAFNDAAAIRTSCENGIDVVPR
jgi:hypothetical protein